VRIRLIAFPRTGELDEFDFQRFRIGGVYDLPPHFASILVIGGHAEPVPPEPSARCSSTARLGTEKARNSSH
jgi:hypothetical protein